MAPSHPRHPRLGRRFLSSSSRSSPRGSLALAWAVRLTGSPGITSEFRGPQPSAERHPEGTPGRGGVGEAGVAERRRTLPCVGSFSSPLTPPKALLQEPPSLASFGKVLLGERRGFYFLFLRLRGATKLGAFSPKQYPQVKSSLLIPLRK